MEDNLCLLTVDLMQKRLSLLSGKGRGALILSVQGLTVRYCFLPEANFSGCCSSLSQQHGSSPKSWQWCVVGFAAPSPVEKGFSSFEGRIWTSNQEFIPSESLMATMPQSPKRISLMSVLRTKKRLCKEAYREHELLLYQSPNTATEDFHTSPHFAFTELLKCYLISTYLCDSGHAFSHVLQRSDNVHVSPDLGKWGAASFCFFRCLVTVQPQLSNGFKEVMFLLFI